MKQNFTSRRLTWVLAIAFAALYVVQLPSAAGQTKGYSDAKEVAAGFDYFETTAGTRFRFAEEFTIPADFFDKGSRPYAGWVAFKGTPIGSFRDQKTDRADTVVERKQSAAFSQRSRGSTIPIQVVALSLESVQPIKVQVGKEQQSWKVRVELSPSRPSEGTMTISSRGDKGGVFSSTFVVYPLYTFTRESDGAERKLDVGAMKWKESSIAKITLRTTAAPWSRSVPSSVSVAGSGFNPGVTISATVINVSESGRLASHKVKIVVPSSIQ